MTKSKKQRKNRTRGQGARDVLNKSLAKAWFMGGSCIDGLKASGTSFTKNPNLILSRPQKWSGILFLFCEDTKKGDNFYQTTKISIKEPMLIDGLVDVMTSSLEEAATVFEVSEENALSEIISVGFFISPSLEADIESALHGAAEEFKRNGCYDRVICEIEHDMHKHLADT